MISRSQHQHSKRLKRRPIPLRRSIRRRTRRVVDMRQIVFSVSGFLVFALLLFLWFSNIFRVETIEYNMLSDVDHQTITREEVSNVLDSYYGKNIFLLSSQDIKDDLLDVFPRIELITIQKKYFPNRLIVNITEASQVVTFISSTKQYALDENGYVIGVSTREDLPMIYAFGESPRLIQKALDEEAARQAEIALSSENDSGSSGADTSSGSDFFSVDEAEGDQVALYSNENKSLFDIAHGDKVMSSEMISYIETLMIELPRIFPGETVGYIELGEQNDFGVVMSSGLWIGFLTDYTLENSLSRLKQTLYNIEVGNKDLGSFIDLRFERVNVPEY